jgi:hypothetical protein
VGQDRISDVIKQVVEGDPVLPLNFVNVHRRDLLKRISDKVAVFIKAITHNPDDGGSKHL